MSAPTRTTPSATFGIYYGYLYSEESSSVLGVASGKSDTKSHYAAIPVYLKYAYAFSDAIKAFSYAGPQFEAGLSSKTTGTFSALGLGTSSTLDNYGDDGILNRFNVSLGFGLGADISDMVRVNFGYNYGLLNLYKGDSSDVKIKNSIGIWEWPCSSRTASGPLKADSRENHTDGRSLPA